MLSDVNDSGFWLVGRYLGMSENIKFVLTNWVGDHRRWVAAVYTSM